PAFWRQSKWLVGNGRIRGPAFWRQCQCLMDLRRVVLQPRRGIAWVSRIARICNRLAEVGIELGSGVVGFDRLADVSRPGMGPMVEILSRNHARDTEAKIRRATRQDLEHSDVGGRRHGHLPIHVWGARGGFSPGRSGPGPVNEALDRDSTGPSGRN